ncbi:hypothetical protein [Erwinia rhapontici]|uniref:hypothetical protein n=1 Tax=Erwinia rhapontici TaxID=55212 RepID=UPI003B9F0B5D
MTREPIGYPRRQPHLSPQQPLVWNWAQNATLANTAQHVRPASERDLRILLRHHRDRVRVMGSRMSPGRMLALQQHGDVLIDTSALVSIPGLRRCKRVWDVWVWSPP